MDETLAFGAYRFEASKLDKVLFPQDGITKKDLIDYYVQIAEVILPHLEDRPVMMHRFPDGIQGEGFYQKDVSDYFPDWITTASVRKEDGKLEQVVVENTATLAYLANQACITPHVWLSRTDKLHHPDLMIFDLDPSGPRFGPVKDAAREIRDILETVGLVPFLKTTGGRGLHVTVPLARKDAFDTVRAFAKDVADLVAQRDPKAFTTETRKEKRRGRVFIDVMRNSYAQTAVAPYAVRAKPKAPVATPLEWEELTQPRLTPRKFTIKNIQKRITQKDDPWKNLMRHARSLAGPRKKLDALQAG